MTGRRAVVTGASIAGLSTAFWLRRTGWEVTVLERAPQFRDGGQNVDVRGVAREVLDRMGLFEAVKARNTTETGTVFVDADGEVTAELPADGPDSATAELEVLRGDLARTIHDHLPDGVELVYDDTVESVSGSREHDEAVERGGDDLAITTAAGRTLTADLLVVAEGVRSATRDRLFGEEVVRKELDVTMVFGTIPRTEDDDDRWRWHTALGGRQIHLRPDPYGTTRAILACSPADPDLLDLDRDELVARLRERFADAGWEAPRVLDGFAGSDDVYLDQLTQITMQRWHHGRVVLAGDAAWSVTPLGGAGASLALVSGYVLAASLSQTGDLDQALGAYSSWMRPLVDEVQDLPPGLNHFAFPRTRLGLGLRHLVDQLITATPLRPLAAKLTEVAGTEQELPAIRV